MMEEMVLILMDYFYMQKLGKGVDWKVWRQKDPKAHELSDKQYYLGVVLSNILKDNTS